jgi:hypothetical protein
MQRKVAEVCAEMPYEQSAKMIFSLLGVRISASWSQDITDSLAKEAHSDLLSVVATPLRCGIESDYHVIQVDGSHIPMKSSWEEVKTATISDCYIDSNNDAVLANTWYHTTKSGKSVFERELTQVVAKRDIDRSKLVVMGDGAKWIWNMYEKKYPGSIQILDFYHASSHIHDVVSQVYGEGSVLIDSKCNELCKQLKHDHRGVEQVIEFIAQNRENASLSQLSRKALSRELAYFERNSSRMRYAEYSKLGLPIGTGKVESTQKWLVQARLKRAGMHWSRTGSRRMLSLRTQIANSTYDKWFEERCASAA